MADPARSAALAVLRAVSEDGAYANLALTAVLRERGLSGRDAALATELAAGSLRRQGTYDAVVAACAGRPLERIDAPVLAVLRLGAHQLLSTRVPPHAAVATSVDLAREVGGRKVTGFVNAVLRRVGEHDLDTWVGRLAPDPKRDRHGHAVLAHAHPRWVVDALAEALASTGRSAELDDLLAADNESPAVTLVARPGLVDPDELLGEAEAQGATRTPYSPLGVRLAQGDPGALAAVRSGRAGVQDEGSQLVALALADAPLEGTDARWLDLCAGPGGKAALLGAIAAQRGATVQAVEPQPHRADLVRRATAALPEGTVRTVVGDGREPDWPRGSFDRVLVDAPCTGLGALRRRPEARWRRVPEDLDGLVPLQQALLGSAIDSVRPGGVVAYVTCSPVLAETAAAVSAVLPERDDLELLDAGAVLPQVPDAAGPLPGTVQLWPHRHGTDAMFLALLRRR
ncbi:rRNA cytosine-C5-methyltransferase [Nocardioides sp. HDW12B]|uniref:RsmB/NOP family class I SAM-dependent RNA methyltransferase n=1 Tax=Nocardioides sp. HDW12B TaxID=2714939 RepID=UPI00140CAE72|nr:transcription antitermination factor NusB [Nocardioides sp. HDW12B]QIK66592.1 rRNA cytosine-C5-methyltransferase [Nocardioides sp. HDW12B]